MTTNARFLAALAGAGALLLALGCTDPTNVVTSKEGSAPTLAMAQATGYSLPAFKQIGPPPVSQPVRGGGVIIEPNPPALLVASKSGVLATYRNDGPAGLPHPHVAVLVNGSWVHLPFGGYLWGVNDTGSIVGTDVAGNAVRVDLNGAQVVVAPGTVAKRAVARAISNTGIIVGSLQSGLPFSWTASGGLKALQVPSSANSGTPLDVNDSGVVVGYVEDKAYRWAANGTGAPLPGTHEVSMATAINNAGLIVGCSNPANSASIDQRGASWSPRTATLQDLMIAGCATDVSDKGRIVGSSGFGEAGSPWVKYIGPAEGLTAAPWSGVVRPQVTTCGVVLAAVETWPDAPGYYTWLRRVCD